MATPRATCDRDEARRGEVTDCEGLEGQCWGDGKRSTARPCPVVTRRHTLIFQSSCGKVSPRQQNSFLKDVATGRSQASLETRNRPWEA